MLGGMLDVEPGGGDVGGTHSDVRVGGQQLRYVPAEKYHSHSPNGCGFSFEGRPR